MVPAVSIISASAGAGLELRKSAADAFKSEQNAEQEQDRRADKHIFKTQIRMTRNDHSKSPFGDRIKTADNIASIIIIVI